jgi:hypothetical protein
MSMGRMTQKRRKVANATGFDSYAAPTRGSWIPTFAGMTQCYERVIAVRKIEGW